MTCPQCGGQNPATARFCIACAAPLGPACNSCSAALPIGARFCPGCGRPAEGTAAQSRFGSPDSYTPRRLAERILTSRGALEGERKQVTVLFADLAASMEVIANRDAEQARQVLDAALERMMEAVHHYDGTVNQVMGDGIMALFGAPVAHEEHAVRACYAALRMQKSLQRWAEELMQLVDQIIERVESEREIVGWPERLDNPLTRHPPAGLERQMRQQGFAFSTGADQHQLSGDQQAKIPQQADHDRPGCVVVARTG